MWTVEWGMPIRVHAKLFCVDENQARTIFALAVFAGRESTLRKDDTLVAHSAETQSYREWVEDAVWIG